MTPAEAAGLLTICAGFDNRKPDADQAKVWALALNGLRPVDCRDAIVAHYQRTREWIMPFDVISGVKRIRNKRVADYGPLPAPPAELTPTEHRAFLARSLQAIGDGEMTSSHAGLPELGEMTRGERDREARRALGQIASRAKALRAEMQVGRADFKATEKPEPEPLLRPEDHSREPVQEDA